MTFHLPNPNCRVTDAVCQQYGLPQAMAVPQPGVNGAFMWNAPFPNARATKRARKRTKIFCIASDGIGWSEPWYQWEHVSVQISLVGVNERISRTPSYEELTSVYERFWDPTDRVVHQWVPKDEHVNCHPYVLHLWRPNENHPLRPHWDKGLGWPAPITVGPQPQSDGVLKSEVR